MNFKDTTRHETLGHKGTQAAVTTATIVICPDIPPTGLKQSMYRHSIPLKMEDIFNSPGISGDTIGQQITRAIIINAVLEIHRAPIAEMYTAAGIDLPEMPVIDRLSPTKTQYQQFGAIFEDEGTIEGTYRVHDSIFLDQLKYTTQDPGSTEPDDFSFYLRLVHGDQLTAERIRGSIFGQQYAERIYDRRQWLLGVPAWFHIQMNLLYTLVKTHFEPPVSSEYTHHSLKADIKAWDRTGYDRDNIQYHLMEPLVRQGFTSRVLLLFYTALSRRGIGIASDTLYGRLTAEDNSDTINTILRRKLTPSLFEAIIEDIRLAAFTISSWDGQGHQDIEYRTMCRFLQEAELLLTIRFAIKHGDIGILRRMVDPLIPLFFGASQHNYGREMLYYRWLLSPVCKPPLQRAILASGLVNWQGKSNTFKPIDLAQEHLNGACKIEHKAYKNSTHDINVVFDRICLSNTWQHQLRHELERTFGHPIPGEHTVRDATLDMFSRARALFNEDLGAPREIWDLDGDYFDSFDVYSHGTKVVAERVAEFNQRQVYGKISSLPYELDAGQAPIDTTEYVNIEDIQDDVEELDLTSVGR